MKQFLSVVSILLIVEGMKTKESDKSVTILTSSNAIVNDYIVKNVDDVLELTCMSKMNQSVGWVIPNYLQNRSLYSPGVGGSSTVTIKHLLVNDTGEYMCATHEEVLCSLNRRCSSHNYSSRATVHVYVKKRKCLGFQCSPTICISERFICDGLYDCLNKEDEAAGLCGPDPCHNKIRCNGRCIPEEWCCINVQNCTRKWEINCCPNSESSSSDTRILRYLGSPQHYNDHYYKQHNNSNITLYPQDASVFSLFETVVHTVRGYVLVLVLIAPLIVIGVCRVYMRHRSFQDCHQGSSQFVAPRIIPRRSDYVTSVTYHPSPHIEDTTNEELHSLAWNQGESLERNHRTDTGTYNYFGNVQSDEPPPYYEVIHLHQEDDQPPPYSSTIDSSGGDDRTTRKIANV